MTYYLRNGNAYRVSDKMSLDIHEHLPAGNYIIQQDQQGNLFLEQIDSFNNPSKLYGDTTRNADRIINTFLDRSNSTGVMLNGEKGSGKTLLAKTLSIKCAEQDIPTIVINAPWHGDRFNQLMQTIEQPCVVLFDEFEKVYDKEEQESILTLLDGVYPSKKLFILTCNDKWRVDQHMRNRPGRIYYMLDFKGLDINFIREYCEDNLKNKEYIDSICKISTIYDSFNFDMMKALVEEMNRYDESPYESLKMLNAKAEYSGSIRYNVEVIRDNQIVRADKQWVGNPLMGDFSIDYVTGLDDDGDPNWDDIHISPNNLVKVDSNEGTFVFKVENGTVKLSREKPKTYEIANIF